MLALSMRLPGPEYYLIRNRINITQYAIEFRINITGQAVAVAKWRRVPRTKIEEGGLSNAFNSEKPGLGPRIEIFVSGRAEV